MPYLYNKWAKPLVKKKKMKGYPPSNGVKHCEVPRVRTLTKMKGYPHSNQASQLGRKSWNHDYRVRAIDLGWREPWANKAMLHPRGYRKWLDVVPLWRLRGPLSAFGTQTSNHAV